MKTAHTTVSSFNNAQNGLYDFSQSIPITNISDVSDNTNRRASDILNPNNHRRRASDYLKRKEQNTNTQTAPNNENYSGKNNETLEGAKLNYPEGAIIKYKKEGKNSQIHEGKIVGYNGENVMIEITPKNGGKLKFAFNYKKLENRVRLAENITKTKKKETKENFKKKESKPDKFKKVFFKNFSTNKKAEENETEINRETFSAITGELSKEIIYKLGARISKLENDYFKNNPEKSQNGITNILNKIKKEPILKIENVVHKELKSLYSKILKIQLLSKKNELASIFRGMYIEFLVERLTEVEKILANKKEYKQNNKSQKQDTSKDEGITKFIFTELQINKIKKRLYEKLHSGKISIKYVYELMLGPYLETKIIKIIQKRVSLTELTANDISLLAESMENHSNNVARAM